MTYVTNFPTFEPTFSKIFNPSAGANNMSNPNGFCMEAVIVSDNYSDFLAHTLPHTKFLFNKIVVVTSYEDKQTQRVCEYHHVMCIKTDELMSRKGEFHKGKGINAGLAHNLI
jgi:hypothetical protein